MQKYLGKYPNVSLSRCTGKGVVPKPTDEVEADEEWSVGHEAAAASTARSSAAARTAPTAAGAAPTAAAAGTEEQTAAGLAQAPAPGGE